MKKKTLMVLLRNTELMEMDMEVESEWDRVKNRYGGMIRYLTKQIWLWIEKVEEIKDY